MRFIFDGKNDIGYDKLNRVGRMAANCLSVRGKSVLQRARNRGNPGTGKPVRQGHRNKPPEMARVKRRCKRPPEFAAMQLPGNPFREHGQAEVRKLGLLARPVYWVFQVDRIVR